MDSFKQKVVNAYETGVPILTDAEYDAIYGDDASHHLVSSTKKTSLPYWMGSLDKVRTQETLDQFYHKGSTAKRVVASQKIDGISALYTGKKLYTRGTGSKGQDISKFISSIKGFSSLPKLNGKQYMVRGEIVMPIKTFQKKYSKTFKNARNLVSGIINKKTVDKAASDLQFYAYEIVDSGLGPLSQLNLLQELGWTVPYHVVHRNAPDFDTVYNSIIEYKSPVEIDGVVLSWDMEYDQPTEGNPKHSVALKQDNEEDAVITEVVDVEWNVSKWSRYKPVVVLKPVNVHGVTISRATGYNAKYIKLEKLGPGSIVMIKRSGGVIPTITKVLKQSEEEIIFPSQIWKGVDLVADTSVSSSDESIVQTAKQLWQSASKMGISHINEATALKLVDNGIYTLLDLVKSTKAGLVKAGLGEKNSEKIHSLIKKVFKDNPVSAVSLLTATGALGYGLGEKKIKTLFEIPMFGKTVKISKPSLLALKGVSVKTAESVLNNYDNAVKTLRNFEKIGIEVTYPSHARVNSALFETKDVVSHEVLVEDSHGRVEVANEVANPLHLRYVFTGFRDPYLENKYDVMNSVTRKTDVLVVKSFQVPETTKMKRARALGIETISLDEFKKLDSMN